MRTLRRLSMVVLTAWVAVVLATAGRATPQAQQGKGKPGGGDNTTYGIRLEFDDGVDFDADGTPDARLLSDGMERIEDDNDADGYPDLIAAAGPIVRYTDSRLAAGDPFVSNTNGDNGLDFDDPNGSSAIYPEHARTFSLTFDDGCVCSTLELAVVDGQCILPVDFSDAARNPRITSSAFNAKKGRSDFSIKFKRSVTNGNQWQVDSDGSNLNVTEGVDENEQKVTSWTEEFTLDRVGSGGRGGFKAGTLCSGFTVPFEITFRRTAIPQ